MSKRKSALFLAAAFLFAAPAAAQEATAPAPAAAAPVAAALPDGDPAIWLVNDPDTNIYLFCTFHALVC